MLRADGIPLYNFGCVVDDHLMEITLVGRGQEHINSTFPQLMLYQALGWAPPEFAHLPLILGPGPREALQAQAPRGGRDAAQAERHPSRGAAQLRRPPGLEPRQRRGHHPASR